MICSGLRWKVFRFFFGLTAIFVADIVAPKKMKKSRVLFVNMSYRKISYLNAQCLNTQQDLASLCPIEMWHSGIGHSGAI